MAVVAPITATGLFNNGESSPRDAQSMEFFNLPGIEYLYSGDTIKIASAFASLSRNVCMEGGLCAAEGRSKSALYEGISPIAGMSNKTPAGNSFETLFNKRVLNYSLQDCLRFLQSV